MPADSKSLGALQPIQTKLNARKGSMESCAHDFIDENEIAIVMPYHISVRF